jgi:hypothetical protein
MANRYAVASGPWSDVATWDGGATLPGVGDTVRPNNYTVTIDQNVTVGLLDNTTASAPAVINGKFLVSGTRVITADIALRGSESIYILTGQHLTINGNMTTGAASYGSNQEAIHVEGGTLVYNGTLQPGTGAASGCIRVKTGAVVTINGEVRASSYQAYCVFQQYGTLTINGDILGGGAITVYSTEGSITWTGGHTAQGDGSRSAIQKSGTGTVDLNGTFNTPVSGLSTPFTWIAASVDVSSFTGKLRIGGTSQVGGLQIAPGQDVCINTAEGFIQEYRSDANWPTSVYDQVPKYLYDRPDTGELPAPSDVREGVTYNTGLADTGTLVVPLPEHVAFGVETDDTVGEAVLRAEDFWSVDVGALPDGSVGKRMGTVSTVESTGAQIAAALNG